MKSFLDVHLEVKRPQYAHVTVIIPCYHSHLTIARSVESVFDQTLLPLEVVIIDDASDDDGKTVGEIKRLIKKYHQLTEIKLLQVQENRGAASARNAGWDIAAQPYIAFLDSDDAWHPRKIEIQYNLMRSNSKIDLSGHSHVINPETTKNWNLVEVPVLFHTIFKSEILFANQFCTPSVMMKTSVPFRFEERKRFAEDYLLWMQIVMSNYHVIKINLPLTATFKSDFGESGLSNDLISMELGELHSYKRLYKLGRLNFFVFLAVCIYSGLKFFRRVAIKISRDGWKLL